MSWVLGKWCLITGAGRGIGKATAEAFAAQGARLILIDIEQQQVDELRETLVAAGTHAVSYRVNVSELDEMHDLRDRVANDCGPVDVLVNNAGILRVGGFDESSFEDFHAVMDVNLWGTVYATKLFAPDMVARRSGAIVNVASASGRVGFSKLTGYSTSKFAVAGFTEALRGELRSSGVTVSLVCPGLVKTTILERAQATDRQRKQAEGALSKWGTEPAVVARAIIRAAERGTPLVHVGRDAQSLSVLARLFPARASDLLSRVVDRLTH